MTLRLRRWAEEALRWLGATAVTLVLHWLLLAIHADSSAAGLAYLVLVVVFASRAGAAVSIYLAILSGLLFDFSFIEPRQTLNISGYQSWVSMAAFVLSCVVVSRVAERARRQTRHAEQRREDVERLYELNQELMLHGDSANLVAEIPRLIERNFGLEQVALYVRSEEQVYATGSLVVPILLPRLASAPVHAELDRTVLEGFIAIHIVFGMNSVGILAWKPDRLSREVALSVAAQVAVVITRAHAIEASARLEAARSTDRLRGALIDSLTHELRTPLTAIRAAATTLVDGSGLDDASRKELATIVDEESSRLDALIGEAMEIAVIESESIHVRVEPVHLETFLEQAVEESHAELGPRRVTIVVEEPESRGQGQKERQAAASVWLDPHLIGRALRHVLENAARYTPESSRIVLRSRQIADRVEFLVEDDGPGIDPHDLPLIFEKFYRGRKHEGGTRGTGMGLAITRALLAAHGGEISARSIPGRGATFCLSIPRIERSPESQPVAGSAITEASTAATAKADAR